jgi:hypothetical protein
MAIQEPHCSSLLRTESTYLRVTLRFFCCILKGKA